jgi:integrating conjugative element protein (TIGR03759 family)
MTVPISNRLGVILPALTLATFTIASLLTPAFAQSVSNTTAKKTHTPSTDSTSTPLSESERERSAVWSLTDTEWHRYQSLLLGIRGSISPANLSPIEVLGIHARDDAERRRFAERWARAMRDDAERILAFQHAYDAAVKRLFSGQTLIDVGKLHALPQKTSELQPDDRILFFTRVKCPACDAMLVKLLSRLESVAGIDIYIDKVPGNDDEVIRAWAEEHGIERAWVGTRRVTLNHDGGALDEITSKSPDRPALYVRRNGQLSTLSYAEL